MPDCNVYEACNDLIVKNKRCVSADEMLAEKIHHLLPIPFLSREDLISKLGEKESLLPHIDLKVLHYFLTQMILQKYPHLINSFDESSLILIGLLVEYWVKDYLSTSNKNEEPVGINNTVIAGLLKSINYRDFPLDI